MAGKRFDPEWLSERFAPLGFVLNLPEGMKGGISFIRPSTIDRLYEHVQIRTGTNTYVDTFLSAATRTSCHKCVSEADYRLRALLLGGSEMSREYPHMSSTRLRSWAEARAWQKKLIDNADAYCRTMASDKGPLLLDRLRTVFVAVDAYVKKLGKMSLILDREFAYVSEGSPEERAEAGRLADLAHSMFYLDLDDARLASTALVRFGPDVEHRSSPFQGIKPHRDAALAGRLILLADYVRKCRNGQLPR